MSTKFLPTESSYKQILRSSSIVGGAQGVSHIIGLLRVKVVAELLGPSGVGIVGLYLTITGLFQTIASAGIQTSGVREIAAAHATGDFTKVSMAAMTLRRVSLLSGLLGWGLLAIFSRQVSLFMFGSDSHQTALALLGSCVLFGIVSGGQMAIVQGMRRIGDLAKMQLVSVAITTIVSIVLYWRFGERGVVLVLIASAIGSLGISWWIASGIRFERIAQSISQTIEQSKELLGLGLAFMWSAVLAAGVAVVIRGFIQRECGLDASGFYQAAWALSGLMANFILTAMTADFFPRLAALKESNELLRKAINEQTEIALLLGIPGVFLSIAFAPIIIGVFYSSEFLASAPLLVWFSVGVFARLISWPLGALTGALNMQKMIYFSQTLDNVILLALTVALIPVMGLLGAPIAFALTNWLSLGVILIIARNRVSFVWSREATVLLLLSTTLLACLVVMASRPQTAITYAAGMLIFSASALLSFRQLIIKVGPESRVAAVVRRIPILCKLVER